MKKINFKNILMGASLVIASLTASQQASAQTMYDWNGIDTIQVKNTTSIDNQKVYIYGTHTAGYKKDKADKKQDAAFADISNIIANELKKEFDHTTFVTVNDPSEVPSDGILVKACLTEIDWGNAALRTMVGFGAGAISGKYTAQVSNSNGLMFEIRNHRFHQNPFASDKGAAVIKVFNRAIGRDLAVAFKNAK